MRRPALVVLLVLSLVAVVGLGSPAVVSEPANAQTQAEWRAADPGDELGIEADEGLSDDELEAVVERSMVRVEAVRGIEFEEHPPVTVVTREEFQREYVGRSGGPTDDQSAFENAKLEALFLVGSDEDATDVQTDNRNTSVAGFYAPGSDEIVVVSNGDEPRLNELTLAHELFHAYQDQRWGLATYDARTQDGRSAELGLIEGDAVYVETLYERRCGAEWECVIPSDAEPGEGDPPARPANLGLLLLDFMPYDAGPAFIETIHDEGGWDAVDALYDEPPRTTEQVVVPATYPDDEPREVAIEDSYSEGWGRVKPEGRPDHDTLGMAAITTMFVDPLYDSGGQHWVISADEWFAYEGTEPPAYGAFDYGSEYATGWDGDRLHVYRHENGGIGYVWRLAWDTPGDAETFAGGFDDLLAYRGAERIAGDTYTIDEGGYEGAYHVSVEGDTVTIVHAPAIDALAEVHEDAEPGTGEAVPEKDGGTSENGEQPADEDQPGFGIVAALVALAAGASLVVRRR